MTSTSGTWYPPSCGTGGFLLANPPFAMTTTFTQSTTPPPNRDQQHGGVEAVGAVEQPIKEALRAGKNWERLTPGQKCALDMIAHKLGRIMSGADPGDPEHWEDLAGYPTAAMRAKE